MFDLKSILKKHLGVGDEVLTGFSFDTLVKKSNALTGEIRRSGWEDKTRYLVFFRAEAGERRPEVIKFFLTNGKAWSRYYLSDEDKAANDWQFFEQTEVL